MNQESAGRDGVAELRPVGVGGQGCFKIGVQRTPSWEAAVGDGLLPARRRIPRRAALGGQRSRTPWSRHAGGCRQDFETALM